MHHHLLLYSLLTLVSIFLLFASLLSLLTIPRLQAHVIYLHSLQFTWFRNLNIPEHFGFAHNQVTPFTIRTPDGEALFAWHILPTSLYLGQESRLLTEPPGHASDVTVCLAFRLLRDDPRARLVVHFHGAGGTVGSGYRVPNYHTLAAAHPGKVHVLTFDYRGFGRSSGFPSEEGLVHDAVSVVEWTLSVAQIPPERIILFGQSLGTAVAIAAAENFAKKSAPVVFSGMVLVAPFVDIASLASTYRLAGIIPLLSPFAAFPALLIGLSRLIKDTWLSVERIAQYVAACEASGKSYRITLIHAMDDCDIPWQHTAILFSKAVAASMNNGRSDLSLLETSKDMMKRDYGAAGLVTEWETANGVVREEILESGLHDVIMGYPVITLAVARIFASVDPSFSF